MASPLDTPTSTSDTTTHTYSVSAGNQRCLIVGIEQEGTTLGAPTVTYGGQSMANAVDIEVNPGTTSQRVTLFYLNDAGIVAASGTTISVSNSVAASISIHAASYQDAMQTTPSNTDTDSSTAATPNPLAACDIVTGAADAVVVALSGMGNSGTAAWGGTLTERTDQQANATATGSLADDSVPTATTIACDCTWTTQNRAAICALELEHDAGVGITSIDPTTFDMDNADVDINGSGFEASQGTGDVYLSDANTLAGSANEVDITSAVNTWSDTVVNLDLTQLSASELDDLHTLGPGQRFVILVNDSSDEYGSTAITLHRPTAFVMSLSANFAPTTTTAQLTAPAGKNTGDMDGGRLEEALNPSTTNTTVTVDDYREDAWCIEATDGSREVVYAFRVLYSGIVADTITQTPKITVTGGISGNGDLGSLDATASGEGTSASAGNGDLQSADSVVSASGVSASSGDGSLVSADSTISGFGQIVLVGSGDLSSAASALAGEGTSQSTGNGNLAAGNATLAAEGTSQSLGNGDLSSADSVVSGSGLDKSEGNGSLVSADSTLAASGVLQSTGNGDLAAGNSTLVAEGTSQSLGNGDLSSADSTLSGSGLIVSSEAFGNGDLGSADSTLSASGLSQSEGNGALVAANSNVAGSGTVLAPGAAVASGNLASAASAVAGEGTSRSLGNGNLTTVSTVSGSGLVQAAAATGDGDLASAVSTLVAEGTSQSEGDGNLQVQAATVSGSGNVIWLGQGDLVSGVATVSAEGLSRSIGNGDLAAALSRIAGSADTGVTLAAGQRRFVYRRRRRLRCSKRAA